MHPCVQVNPRIRCRLRSSSSHLPHRLPLPHWLPLGTIWRRTPRWLRLRRRHSPQSTRPLSRHRPHGAAHSSLQAAVHSSLQAAVHSSLLSSFRGSRGGITLPLRPHSNTCHPRTHTPNPPLCTHFSPRSPHPRTHTASHAPHPRNDPTLHPRADEHRRSFSA